MSKSGYRRMKETDYSNPLEWEERLFFEQMKNLDLVHLTSGQFRSNIPSGTHPVFLLRQIAKGDFEFCPCSSQDYNKKNASYIPQNSRTSPRGLRVKENSYILHFLTFNLTSSNHLVDRMPLLGRIDEDDIIGDYHKKRGGG